MQAGGFRARSGLAVSAPRTINARRERGLGFEPEQPQHGVEAAALAFVRKLDPFDVERLAAGFARHRLHELRIDERKRVGVEKAANQPGAGDAVDLRPPPGDPRLGCCGARRSSVALSTSGRPDLVQAA